MTALKVVALLLVAYIIPATALAAGRAPLPDGPPTSVDAPAAYRPLDWVSREDIESLPASQRPFHTGICPGYYLPPRIVGSGAAGDVSTDAPIEAASDHYEMIGRDTIRMEGDVVVQQGRRLLESQRLEIDTRTKQADLNDAVRVRQEGMLLTGEHARLELDTRQLAVDEAEYVIHQTHIRGSAGRIYNTPANVLVLDQSTYTTCEPDANTWTFSSEELRLNRATGWGTAKNAFVRVKDVPVIYVPWIMFPIDDRRQSGFLFPSIGTNDETGLDISQPYYWNIAPDMDATLTPRYMSLRGTALESEFRYLTPASYGELGGSYLERDELRDDEKRYLALWRHASQWDNGWSAATDYSRVSDPDYFTDLGTDLNASAQTHLNQSALTQYRTDHWNFLALVQRFQTLDKIITSQFPEAEPYRRMPQLRADGFGMIGRDGWNWTLASETVRFEHPRATTNIPQEADRSTLSPGLGYRAEVPWGYVSPRVRAVQTQYHLVGGPPVDDETPDISTYITSLDSGLIFERTTRLGRRAQLQTLEPRLFLLHAPEASDQNALPLFDTASYSFSYDQLFRDNRFVGGDRYGDARQASVGLTSRMISREDGEEWLRMSIGQAFFFDDRDVQLSANALPQDTPRSAIANRINWQVGTHWLFYEESEWDEQTNNIDNLSTGVQFTDKDFNVINLGYLYRDPGAVSANPGDEKLKQSDLSFIAPLTARWSLLARWGYDIELERSFDNMFGVEYESCCWRARLVNRRFLEESELNLTEVEAKQGIYLQVQLKGLGGVGNQVESLLEGGIPGFEDRTEHRRYLF